MNSLSKQLSIAVIGAPSCGKSYLLFDLIHAFHVLGYRPDQLDLDYQYSSFGTFFYDTFNADTGGMKGTVKYAFRPESHYGAHLKSHTGRSLWVDFLNIPGEAFQDLEVIENYFALKDKIERNERGLFWLTKFRAPSGHVIKLVLPSKEFSLSDRSAAFVGAQDRHVKYMSWENINALLRDGDYEEIDQRRNVSGKYVFSHLAEILTDSIKLCLQENWRLLDTYPKLPMDLAYYEEHVFDHFYSLSYCQNATDLVVCDNLKVHNSSADLSMEVGKYLDNLKSHAPNVYLAFRNADLLLNDKVDNYKRILSAASGQGEILKRNQLYSKFMDELMDALAAEDGGWVGKEMSDYIFQGVGRSNGYAFWELLGKSLARNNKFELITSGPSKPLPPHVYFTATPIDSSFDIYENDPSDVTRFYLDNGIAIKSFVRETCQDMSRHFCWGSLQLLMDIMAQNSCLPSSIKNSSTETLNYFFRNK